MAKKNTMTKAQKVIFASVILDELRAAVGREVVKELIDELERRDYREGYAADKVVKLFQDSPLCLIIAAFDWSSSEKGCEYWSSVSRDWWGYCLDNTVETVIANVERNYHRVME